MDLHDSFLTNSHLHLDSSLHIANVRKEDLGVYQCVARSQDEWVTHVATLSLKNEPLISQSEHLVSIRCCEVFVLFHLDEKREAEGYLMGIIDYPYHKLAGTALTKTHGDSRGSRIKKNGETRYIWIIIELL